MKADAAARVRKQAIENARADAEQAAAMVGKTVGDAVSIGGPAPSGWSYTLRLMGRLTDLPTEYTGMNPDAITVSHTVSVTFELKE